MTGDAESRAHAAAGAAPKIGARAVAYLLFAGALYGLLFSINKVATTNGVPGLAYVFWHTLGAGLILWLGCLATRTPVRFDRAHLRLYFVAGALGISIPVSLLAHVAPNLPASLVVMVTCLSPTCTYLMAMALRMERFRLLSTGGVALGLAGILILVVPGITLPSFAEVSWLLLALLAPVCFAAFNIAGAILWPPKAHSLGLACGIQLGGAVVLVPVMLGTGETYLFPGPLLAGDLAILGATGVTALVWYLIFEILRLGGPLFLSQFGYIIVLTGFGWGAVIFGERLSGSAWIAAALPTCCRASRYLRIPSADGARGASGKGANDDQTASDRHLHRPGAGRQSGCGLPPRRLAGRGDDAGHRGREQSVGNRLHGAGRRGLSLALVHAQCRGRSLRPCHARRRLRRVRGAEAGLGERRVRDAERPAHGHPRRRGAGHGFSRPAGTSRRRRRRCSRRRSARRRPRCSPAPTGSRCSRGRRRLRASVPTRRC